MIVVVSVITVIAFRFKDCLLDHRWLCYRNSFLQSNVQGAAKSIPGPKLPFSDQSLGIETANVRNNYVVTEQIQRMSEL